MLPANTQFIVGMLAAFKENPLALPSRAELDTLNDLQELAAVLQTSSAGSGSGSSSSHAVSAVTAPSNRQSVTSTTGTAVAVTTYTTVAATSNHYGLPQVCCRIPFECIHHCS